MFDDRAAGSWSCALEEAACLALEDAACLLGHPTSRAIQLPSGGLPFASFSIRCRPPSKAHPMTDRSVLYAPHSPGGNCRDARH